MSNQRRIDLDIVRCWLCTAVMLVHVFGMVIPYYGMEQLQISTFFGILNKWVNLTVPGFIFLSGYLTLRGKKEFDAQRFLKSRLGTTLPWYLVFSCGYVILFYRAEGLKGLLIHIAKGTACYQLYFVPIIVQLYLLTPLLVPLIRKHPRFSLLMSALLSYGFAVANTLFYPLLTGYYWCLPYLIYYVWGIVAGTEQPVRWADKRFGLAALLYTILAVIVGALVHLAAYAWFFPLPKPWNSFMIDLLEILRNLLGIAVLMQVGLRGAERLRGHEGWSRFFVRASGLSYMVYLSHPLLLGLLAKYIVSAPWRLFFVLPPLGWAAAWCYDEAERRFLRWWRMLREKENESLPM